MLLSPNGESKNKKIAKTVLKGVIIFFLITSFWACGRKGSSNVTVVYQVAVSSDIPYEVFIAYKDSTGYITLYVKKDWMIKVELPRRSVASLLVISQKDLYADLKNPEFAYSSREQNNQISGWIIHDGNIVSDSSDDIVAISVITSAL